MGMFDYVKVNIDKLPITDEEKEQYGHRFNFQSKDWECELSILTITDDGHLTYRAFDHGWNAEAINFFGGKGCLTEENVRIETIPHHGFINFYDYIDGIEFDFLAKFTDGKLVEITRRK